MSFRHDDPRTAILLSTFMISLVSKKKEEAKSQKPIVMEQLKQIIQLKQKEIPIREIASRIGISRNSVRKYLAVLIDNESISTDELSNKPLAGKAYKNDLLEKTLKREQLIIHFKYA